MHNNIYIYIYIYCDHAHDLHPRPHQLSISRQYLLFSGNLSIYLFMYYCPFFFPSVVLLCIYTPTLHPVLHLLHLLHIYIFSTTSIIDCCFYIFNVYIYYNCIMFDFSSFFVFFFFLCPHGRRLIFVLMFLRCILCLFVFFVFLTLFFFFKGVFSICMEFFLFTQPSSILYKVIFFF